MPSRSPWVMPAESLFQCRSDVSLMNAGSWSPLVYSMMLRMKGMDDFLFGIREEIDLPVVDENVLDAGCLLQGESRAAFGRHEAVRVAHEPALYGAEEIEVMRQDDLFEMWLLLDVLQIGRA